MPFIPGKLKPRIKPRIGPKLGDNSQGASTELSQSGNGASNKVESDKPVQLGVASQGCSNAVEVASTAATKSLEESSASHATDAESPKSASQTADLPIAETTIRTPCTVDHGRTSPKPLQECPCPASSLETNDIAVDITRESKTEQSFSKSNKNSPPGRVSEQVSLGTCGLTVNQDGVSVKNDQPGLGTTKPEERVDAVPGSVVAPPTSTKEVDESSKVGRVVPKVGNQLGLKFHRPNLKAKSRPNVALARSVPSTNSEESKVVKNDLQSTGKNDAEESSKLSRKGLGEGETAYQHSHDNEPVHPGNDVVETLTLVQPATESPSVAIDLPNEVQQSQSQLLTDESPSVAIDLPIEVQQSQSQLLTLKVASCVEQLDTVGETPIEAESRGVNVALGPNKTLRKPLRMRKIPKLTTKKNRPEAVLTPTPPPESPDEQDALTREKFPPNEDANNRDCDLEVTCVADIENISQETVPVIDTALPKSSVPNIASPLAAVNSNSKSSLSVKHGSLDSPGVRQEQDEASVKSLLLKNNSKSKTSKPEAEDVKTLYAISAVDYLRRHDHALGDSILRRLIIGDKNLQNRKMKPTMCSSCNPQTLRKCLASLWSFDKTELLAIVKKSADRQKIPLSYANFPGKPLFKPSLGRQRAPTLTASTYGKMSLEVKERLVHKYGTDRPELSKLRMLDLIFYNPSDNPLSKPSKDDTLQNKTETTTSKGEPCTDSPTDSLDSDSDNPDDPIDQEPKEVESGDQASSSLPVPQVRIGDEGQIILAAESLVMKKKESDVLKAPVLQEFSFADSNRKKKNAHRTTWTFEETLDFYKALHGIGTDFTSMKELFPNRTRQNLKTKFKREEKKNPALIDKVLITQGQNLDFADVEKELAADKTLRRLCRANDKPFVKRIYQSRYLNPGTSSERSSEDAAEVPLASNIPVRKRSQPKDTLEDSADKTKLRKKFTKVNKQDDCAHDESPKSDSLKPAKDGPIKEGKSAPVFKMPTSRPLRKKTVPCVTMPKFRVVPGNEASTSPPGSSETNDQMDSEGVFKKPLLVPPTLKRKGLKRRLPKKRKAPKLEEGNSVPLHRISFEDDPVDDTEDDDSHPVKSPDESFTIKTDVDCGSYNVTRSVTVNFSEPDVPVDINETIEHKECAVDRVECAGNSEEEGLEKKCSEEEGLEEEGLEEECLEEEDLGEEDSGEDVSVEDQMVEVVTIDVNEISSYLERTGAVVVGRVDRESGAMDPLLSDQPAA